MPFCGRSPQRSQTFLTQTVSILLTHRRQLPFVDPISGAPAHVGGLTEKRSAAFSTFLFDAHHSRLNEYTPMSVVRYNQTKSWGRPGRQQDRAEVWHQRFNRTHREEVLTIFE